MIDNNLTIKTFLAEGGTASWDYLREFDLVGNNLGEWYEI